jgi:chromosome segregation ATPase
VRQPSPETIRKLVSKFRDIDPAYLRGESESVTVQKSSSTQQQQTYIDPASEHNATISAYVQLANRLTDDLKRKDQEMADRLADKDAIIAEKQSRIESLERTISNLERTVADKDTIIRARDARILELERRIAQSSADDLTKYPFSIGAAEQNETLNTK